MPRQRTGPSAPPPASMTAPTSSGLTPNFETRDPVARPACVSGSTDGFSRTSASRRRRSGRPRAPRRVDAAASIARASAAASSADSTAIQRSGSPAAAARTAARRSASVLPIPSSVIAAFGDAGPARQRPLAARDDVGAEPVGGQPRDERRQVVRLQRVGAQPRVGEGGPHGLGGRIEGGPVGDVERGAVAPGRRAQGRRASGPGVRPVRRTAAGPRPRPPSVGNDERGRVPRRARRRASRAAAATIVAWVRRSGGKSPTLMRAADLVRDVGRDEEEDHVHDEADEAHRARG